MREGEAVAVAAGLPRSMSGQAGDQEREVSWYEFGCACADMTWDEMAPNSRRSIATATAALLANTKGAPKPKHLGAALYGWASNAKLRRPTLRSCAAPNVDRAEHQAAGRASRRLPTVNSRHQIARPYGSLWSTNCIA